MIARAVDLCRKAGLGCEVFSGVQPNPLEAHVTAGVAAFRAGRMTASSRSAAAARSTARKAIAMMVGQTRPIWDFEDREDWYTRVDVDRHGAGRRRADDRRHRLRGRSGRRVHGPARSH